jgi:paraquat-inducible protein B
MTEKGTRDSGDAIEAPEPIVEKGRGISLVWVIPVVAIIVGGVIAFDAIQNRGVPVVINLPNAEWVDAGKTKIRYLSVEVGTVDSVEVNEDRDGVELHCTFHRDGQKYLTEGAQFWLVHPRFGAGGISGLGTILSGAYVAMRLGPADGEPKREFDGLDRPPLESERSPGLTIQLHAGELNSLDVDSPIYYRENEVGKVERHELAKDGSGVVLSLFFPAEHADLVREDSRFWNASGIQISGSLAHLEVEAEPLEAILAGGIAFDSPRGQKAKPAEKNASFWLHPTKSDVETYPFRYGGLRIYVEAPQLGSLAIGDQVYYREIPVGAVISQELKSDSRHVRVGLNIQQRYATLVRSNSVFWNASGISANLGLHGLQIHAESLAAILAGGVAFATPNSPGHAVKAGSVFQMRSEVKDDWLEWSPLIWRGPPGKAPSEATENKSGDGKESGIARFFHHKDKNEEESQKAGEPNKGPSQEGAQEKKRHGFFRGLFHRDQKDEKDKQDQKDQKDQKDQQDQNGDDQGEGEGASD